MDTTDREIQFDKSGICNHCREYEHIARKELLPEKQAKKELNHIVNKIQQAGKEKKYDSILGLIGGTDSSYMAYVTESLGLRPLVVHFDNGWNTEISQINIDSLIRNLDLDLYTFVMDWEEFKAIQLSYLKALVIDIEVPTDHMILAVLYKLCKRTFNKVCAGRAECGN